ncbi:ParB/RepB/Spo0J family partition protein [Amphiplicatus metriothermophilus]|uniref:Chromosome partitioning protein, ParB family n=1 Tax=Amphiplicatus metriothermophilus TaxID=1519374 RepID=A0A239PJM6_9PROT|nr:ParB/RepB/Spo0J family partition protein [Amphiplicatus metriothermophilus]MBB5517668.1 ParB family chromosome partitioning protein [Amphiplicatus metriothermophilus]SNT67998.1 chromosome partitioning protein, ParB family [Amphiplicatus metriothermophilus]
MAALKKGLGRGLDALLADAPSREAEAPARAEAPPAAARGKSTLPVAFLRPNPDQPRRHFNEDAIEELAESIRARGLLQPILVRPKGPDEYEIVAGERRWRAAQKAKIHDVPVVIRELTDEEAAEIALIENVQRVDLNPVEEARAYRRLAEVHGRTQEAIAKAVGKSRSHVANMMRLLDLPELSLDLLARGDITMGHARAILAAPNPDLAAAAVRREGLSVRETERFVAELQAIEAERRSAPASRGRDDHSSDNGKSAQGRSVSGKKDADTRALEADLAAALGLEVSIEHSAKGSGTVSLRYLDLDQLDEICRRLMGAGA